MNSVAEKISTRIGFLRGPNGNLANHDADTMLVAVREIERLESIIIQRNAEIETLLAPTEPTI